MTIQRPIAERFWPRVRKTDTCWLWTGFQWKGYGRIGTGKATEGLMLTHRAAWVLTFGPIPCGMQVLHKCDVPLCVNPAHLFLGTQRDNMIDMARKRRHSAPAARLSPAQVLDVREYLRQGVRVTDVAAYMGVTHQTISKLKHRQTWKHIA